MEHGIDHIVGIDLGTTNSVVSILENDQPHVIVNSEGSTRTPSVVSFMESGEILVGEIARRQAAVNPSRTITSAKRLMGRQLHDIENLDLTFPFELAEIDGRLLVKIGSEGYSPAQISAFVLNKLKQAAEEYVGEPVSKAIITVPAYFDDLQRQATYEAGRLAGLEVLRLINEPTAAAMAYGLGRGTEERVAVYDFGGGTFDVTILDIAENTFEVLTSIGDTHLGGDDIDDVIVQYLTEQFQKTAGADFVPDPMAFRRLKDAAEKAKCELSIARQTSIHLPFLAYSEGQPLHLEAKLTREQLEDLIYPLANRTIAFCKQAIKDCAIEASSIDKVILVGGSSRIPLVQELVEEFFSIVPFKGINPDEIVAMGAATQAGVLAGKLQEVLLLDVTPHSLGVEVRDNRVSKVVEKNSTIPIKAAKVFTTTEDGQDMVMVHVLQGEGEKVGENRSLGKFTLTGLSDSKAGVPRIQVTFHINANGMVEVSAEDLATKQQKSISLALGGDDTAMAGRERSRSRKRPRVRRPATETGGEVIAAPHPSQTQVGQRRIRIAGEGDSAAFQPLVKTADNALKPMRIDVEDVEIAAPQQAAAAPAPPPRPQQPPLPQPPPAPAPIPPAPAPATAAPLTVPSAAAMPPPPVMAPQTPEPQLPASSAAPPTSGPVPTPLEQLLTESMKLPAPPAAPAAPAAKPAPAAPEPPAAEPQRPLTKTVGPLPPAKLEEVYATLEEDWPRPQGLSSVACTALGLLKDAAMSDDARQFYLQASRELADYFERNSGDQRCDYGHILMLICLGQPEKARGMIEKRLEDSAADPEALLALIDCFIDKFPTDVPGIVLRATTRASIGQVDAAINDLEGVCSEEIGSDTQVRRLINLYQTRLQGDETDEETQFKLVKLMLREKRLDEAISILQKLSQSTAYGHRALKILGLSYWQKGMHYLAWQKFQQLPLTDEIEDILYRLACDMEETEQLLNAKVVFQHLYTLDPDFRDVGDRLKQVEIYIRQQAADLAGSVTPTAFATPRDSRFVILEEINRGSMGIIYRARDTVLEEIVALKILNDYMMTDPMAVERFKREARAAKKLSHPNIVRIHDMFEHGNKRILSMEYIEGDDMKKILRERRVLPPREVVELAQGVCAALAYAHQLGIVHRDIKPANIMITKTGGVKVTDFGIAKFIVAGPESTRSGSQILGTPLYMSPEQIRGDQVDERTDIYSLGATLYEALTGKPPFAEGNIEYHHLHTRPADLPQKIPMTLSSIIMTCLEKNPENRFQSIAELSAALRDAILE